MKNRQVAFHIHLLFRLVAQLPFWRSPSIIASVLGGNVFLNLCDSALVLEQKIYQTPFLLMPLYPSNPVVTHNS